MPRTSNVCHVHMYMQARTISQRHSICACNKKEEQTSVKCIQRVDSVETVSWVVSSASPLIFYFRNRADLSSFTSWCGKFDFMTSRVLRARPSQMCRQKASDVIIAVSIDNLQKRFDEPCKVKRDLALPQGCKEFIVSL